MDFFHGSQSGVFFLAATFFLLITYLFLLGFGEEKGSIALIIVLFGSLLCGAFSLFAILVINSGTLSVSASIGLGFLAMVGIIISGLLLRRNFFIRRVLSEL